MRVVVVNAALTCKIITRHPFSLTNKRIMLAVPFTHQSVTAYSIFPFNRSRNTSASEHLATASTVSYQIITITTTTMLQCVFLSFLVPQSPVKSLFNKEFTPQKAMSALKRQICQSQEAYLFIASRSRVIISIM